MPAQRDQIAAAAPVDLALEGAGLLGMRAWGRSVDHRSSIGKQIPILSVNGAKSPSVDLPNPDPNLPHDTPNPYDPMPGPIFQGRPGGGNLEVISDPIGVPTPIPSLPPHFPGRPMPDFPDSDGMPGPIITDPGPIPIPGPDLPPLPFPVEPAPGVPLDPLPPIGIDPSHPLPPLPIFPPGLPIDWHIGLPESISHALRYLMNAGADVAHVLSTVAHVGADVSPFLFPALKIAAYYSQDQRIPHNTRTLYLNHIERVMGLPLPVNADPVAFVQAHADRIIAPIGAGASDAIDLYLEDLLNSSARFGQANETGRAIARQATLQIEAAIVRHVGKTILYVGRPATTTQMRALISAFPQYRVRSQASKATHPVAQATRFAFQGILATRLNANMFANAPVHLIGANPRETAFYHRVSHVCNPVESGRDALRVLGSTAGDNAAMAQFGCGGRFEDCNVAHPLSVGLSMFGTGDLSLAEFAITMHRKHMTRAFVAVNVPFVMLDERIINYIDPIQSFEYRREGDYIDMRHLQGFAAGYRQLASALLSWVSAVPTIEGLHVQVEEIGRCGTSFLLEIGVVAGIQEIIPSAVQLDEPCYILPYMVASHKLLGAKIPHAVIPAKRFENVVAYAGTLAPAGRTPEKILQKIRGQVSEISINKQVVEERWDLDLEVMNAVVCHAILACEMQERERKSGLSRHRSYHAAVAERHSRNPIVRFIRGRWDLLTFQTTHLKQPNEVTIYDKFLDWLSNSALSDGDDYDPYVRVDTFRTINDRQIANLRTVTTLRTAQRDAALLAHLGLDAAAAAANAAANVGVGVAGRAGVAGEVVRRAAAVEVGRLAQGQRDHYARVRLARIAAEEARTEEERLAQVAANQAILDAEAAARQLARDQRRAAINARLAAIAAEDARLARLEREYEEYMLLRAAAENEVELEPVVAEDEGGGEPEEPEDGDENEDAVEEFLEVELEEDYADYLRNRGPEDEDDEPPAGVAVAVGIDQPRDDDEEDVVEEIGGHMPPIDFHVLDEEEDGEEYQRLRYPDELGEVDRRSLNDIMLDLVADEIPALPNFPHPREQEAQNREEVVVAEAAEGFEEREARELREEERREDELARFALDDAIARRAMPDYAAPMPLAEVAERLMDEHEVPEEVLRRGDIRAFTHLPDIECGMVEMQPLPEERIFRGVINFAAALVERDPETPVPRDASLSDRAYQRLVENRQGLAGQIQVALGSPDGFPMPDAGALDLLAAAIARPRQEMRLTGEQVVETQACILNPGDDFEVLPVARAFAAEFARICAGPHGPIFNAPAMLIDGIASSAKSTMVRRYLQDNFEGNTLIVVPSRKLARDWENEMRPFMHRCTVVTQHQIPRGRFARMVIDEAYMLEAPHINAWLTLFHAIAPFGPAVLIGDRDQNVAEAPLFGPFDPQLYRHRMPIMRLYVAFTVPQDVMHILIQRRIVPVLAQTASPIAKSLVFRERDPAPNSIFHHQAPGYLALTSVVARAARSPPIAEFIAHGYEPHDLSIAQAQGSRTRTSAIALLDGHVAFLLARERSLYVMLTRHTHVMYINASDRLLDQFFPQRTRLVLVDGLKKNRFNAPFMTDGVYEHADLSADELTATQSAPASRLAFVPEFFKRVGDVISDLFRRTPAVEYANAADVQTLVAHFQTDFQPLSHPEYIPLSLGAVGTLSKTSDEMSMPEPRVGRCLIDGADTMAAQQSSGQAFLALKNIVERQFTTSHAQQLDVAAVERAMIMFRRFTETCFADVATVQHDGHSFAVEWAQTRLPNYLRALDQPFGESTSTVDMSSFLKTQVKMKPEPGFASALGYGQSVVAGHPSYNVLFSADVRGYTARLLALLRPDVIIDAGYNDQELERMVLESGAHAKFMESNCMIDIRKQDSSHTISHVLLQTMLMEYVGMPADLVELYFSMRSHYRVRSKGSKLYQGTVSFNLPSGDPFTLIANCVQALASIVTRYDIAGRSMIMKGDDFICDGEDLPLSEHAHIIQDQNVDFKVVLHEAPYHAGRFVVPSGMLPDPVRIVLKMLARPADHVPMRELWRSVVSRDFTPTDLDVRYLVHAIPMIYPAFNAELAFTVVRVAIMMRNEHFFCSLFSRSAVDERVESMRDCAVTAAQTLVPDLSAYELERFRSSDQATLRREFERLDVPVFCTRSLATTPPVGFHGVVLSPNHCYALVPRH